MWYELSIREFYFKDVDENTTKKPAAIESENRVKLEKKVNV